jgi:hypothetical protein
MDDEIKHVEGDPSCRCEVCFNKPYVFTEKPLAKKDAGSNTLIFVDRSDTPDKKDGGDK